MTNIPAARRRRVRQESDTDVERHPAIMDRPGGGSFTEFQALDFHRGHMEMGHDGPARIT